MFLVGRVEKPYVQYNLVKRLFFLEIRSKDSKGNEENLTRVLHGDTAFNSVVIGDGFGWIFVNVGCEGDAEIFWRFGVDAEM